jgi:hypothetical protein
MKLPSSQRLILDTATGKYRIIEQINPKLDASRKLQMRKSKKTKVVRRKIL